MMCSACGASVVGALAQQDHDRYHEGMIPREEARSMSQVLWCDNGGHAFKAGAPGSQSFTGTEVDEEGNVKTVKMDVCATHTFQAMAETTTKAALTATAVDAETLQD